MTCDAVTWRTVYGQHFELLSARREFLIKHAHIYFCTLISALLYDTRTPRPSVSRSKAFWWVGREAFVAVETLSNWQEVRMWKIAVVRSVGLILVGGEMNSLALLKGGHERRMSWWSFKVLKLCLVNIIFKYVNQFSHVSTTLPGWPKEWSH